ncbi:M15 family metallopeptidase [Cohnella hongkongensis]|uniref:D-alanyl-D-alanine carboxypeptidase family protein n=1 Tax=Cohnella hongkongensis TaxID=178337 RepID=A0ABV9F6Y5_9BACL
MKKALCGVILLLLLGFGWNALRQPWADDEAVIVVLEGDAPEWQEPQSARKMLTIGREEISRGDLLLVNSRYPVSKGAKLPEVVNLSERPELAEGIGIAGDGIELPPDLLRKFVEMVEAARADGVDQFLITSGYRNEEKQAELYERLGADYANPPGHSEHNLGLSLDVGSSLGLMKDAPEGKWLEENAWKHGFVLRYPEDKTDITGIRHEPWHFRYVGLPHSAIMREQNRVLEEYLDYLKEQGRIQAEVNGTAYVVSYYSLKDSPSLSIPVSGSYTISGDNKDGVIVTTWGAGSPGAKEAGPS